MIQARCLVDYTFTIAQFDLAVAETSSLHFLQQRGGYRLQCKAGCLRFHLYIYPVSFLKTTTHRGSSLNGQDILRLCRERAFVPSSRRGALVCFVLDSLGKYT